ncbi:hypothetical protein SynPROS71_02186 [Synechococcus sp. PROS-7-1]|uniref:hypothetical protein n=1 Tax=Synechococcus sp. PROS-7-1 TaxID=1442556 RepID=UPI001644AAB4|nr:hypothetical protein [Synechococcus sp. PROS-7-1]QNI85955.1 hypothetical protein SynPROS71_02186 [Synechococcus sp. PROS-7-1]
MTPSAATLNRSHRWDAAESFDAITGQATSSPMFDEQEDFNKESRNIARKIVIKETKKKLGPVGLIADAPDAVNGYTDSSQIKKDYERKVREGFDKGTKEGVEEVAYHVLSPTGTLEEKLKIDAQKKYHDPNASPVNKVGAAAVHGTVYVIRRTVGAPISLAESGIRWAVRGIFSWFDEVEDEGFEAGGQETQNRAAIRDRVFGSAPETLAPIDLNASVITDVSQQQDGPGADLVGGQMNQGVEPYQAQDDKYAVLA